MPWAIQWPHIAWDVNTTCEQLHFPNVLGLTRLSPFLRSLSLTALLGSLIVSPHQSSHFSRQSGSLHSFYTRTPLEVHHSQAELNTGTLDPSTREWLGLMPLQFTWYLPRVLRGAFTISALHFFPPVHFVLFPLEVLFLG